MAGSSVAIRTDPSLAIAMIHRCQTHAAPLLPAMKLFLSRTTALDSALLALSLSALACSHTSYLGANQLLMYSAISSPMPLSVAIDTHLVTHLQNGTSRAAGQIARTDMFAKGNQQ